MEALDNFLAMGGYAAYVWPSYLLAAAVLLVLFLVSRGRLRRGEKQLRDLEAAREGAGRRRPRGGGRP